MSEKEKKFLKEIEALFGQRILPLICSLAL